VIGYKVSFETVSAVGHPEYYRGTRPAVRPEQVPEDHWHTVERAGDGVHGQYNGLRRLMAEGELIRNVRLWTCGSLPEVEWRVLLTADSPPPLA